MGNCGQDIPFETQFLIVEARDGSNVEQGSKDGMDQSALYVVFLPILEGDFRAVLQGNEQNELEICLESGMKWNVLVFVWSIYGHFGYLWNGYEKKNWFFAGDPAVEDFEGSHLVFVAAGPDPFDVITNAVK